MPLAVDHALFAGENRPSCAWNRLAATLDRVLAEILPTGSVSDTGDVTAMYRSAVVVTFLVATIGTR